MSVECSLLVTFFGKYTTRERQKQALFIVMLKIKQNMHHYAQIYRISHKHPIIETIAKIPPLILNSFLVYV